MIMAENTEMDVYLTDDELRLLIQCANFALSYVEDFNGDKGHELELLIHTLDRERARRLES